MSKMSSVVSRTADAKKYGVRTRLFDTMQGIDLSLECSLAALPAMEEPCIKQ
jgi:hypothetical protein